jgi:hypothetical protein
VTFADQHHLRGLVALHALDARLLKDRGFYKLKNRFMAAVARQPETIVKEYVDANGSNWLAISSMGYCFRIPGRLASKEMRARATFAYTSPEMTPAPEGDINVEAELRALDDAGRVLNGSAPAARTMFTSANA